MILLLKRRSVCRPARDKRHSGTSANSLQPMLRYLSCMADGEGKKNNDEVYVKVCTSISNTHTLTLCHNSIIHTLISLIPSQKGSYSETSNNGLSERRTTSVQRTKSMPPDCSSYRNSIFGTSEKRTPHYSGQRTASVPPKDSTLYKITSESGQRPKPRAQIIKIISSFGR